MWSLRLVFFFLETRRSLLLGFLQGACTPTKLLLKIFFKTLFLLYTTVEAMCGIAAVLNADVGDEAWLQA